jgi:hypothetical protein
MFKLLLFVLPFAMTAHPLFAQDIMAFLAPDAPGTSLEVDGLISQVRDFDDTEKRSAVQIQTIEVSQRIYKGEKNQVSLGLRYQKLDFSGSFPVNDFYNQQGIVGLRHTLPENRFFLTNVAFGSSSDRPFKSSRDHTLNANGILKLQEKWFAFVNYSNNRTFLNNVPLPGAFYVAFAGRSESLILGFPFIFWLKPLSDNWSIRYFGLIPWTHRARLLYTKNQFVRPYIAFEQQPLTYFRHDRDKERARIFWFERRLQAGVETGLSRDLRIDLGAGHSFDRQLFESRTFLGKKEFQVNLANSWFMVLNIRYRL